MKNKDKDKLSTFLADLLFKVSEKQKDGTMIKDITGMIERVEILEERLGFELKGFFAGVDDKNRLIVNGELHAREGREPDCSIMIIISVKDIEGRVLRVMKEYVSIKDFFLFKTFSKNIDLGKLSSPVEKLLIYLEKS